MAEYHVAAPQPRQDTSSHLAQFEVQPVDKVTSAFCRHRQQHSTQHETSVWSSTSSWPCRHVSALCRSAYGYTAAPICHTVCCTKDVFKCPQLLTDDGQWHWQTVPRPWRCDCECAVVQGWTLTGWENEGCCVGRTEVTPTVDVGRSTNELSTLDSESHAMMHHFRSARVGRSTPNVATFITRNTSVYRNVRDRATVAFLSSDTARCTSGHWLHNVTRSCLNTAARSRESTIKV